MTFLKKLNNHVYGPSFQLASMNSDGFLHYHPHLHTHPTLKKKGSIKKVTSKRRNDLLFKRFCHICMTVCQKVRDGNSFTCCITAQMYGLKSCLTAATFMITWCNGSDFRIAASVYETTQSTTNARKTKSRQCKVKLQLFFQY